MESQQFLLEDLRKTKQVAALVLHTSYLVTLTEYSTGGSMVSAPLALLSGNFFYLHPNISKQIVSTLPKKNSTPQLSMYYSSIAVQILPQSCIGLEPICPNYNLHESVPIVCAGDDQTQGAILDGHTYYED